MALQKGGFCHAGCGDSNLKAANKIKTKNSSLLYLIHVVPGSAPEVLEIFQFHSDENAPKYNTSLNPEYRQCINERWKLLEGQAVKDILKKNGLTRKDISYGILTGKTTELKMILQNCCYKLSPDAIETINSIP